MINIFNYIIAAGFLAIIYGYITGRQILSANPGNKKMQEITGSKRNIDGYYSAIGGSLQPALLVRGLKKTAENKGIKIFEHSAMLSYQENKNIIVKTKNGSVECKKLIVTINAWTPSFFPF